MGWKFVKVWWNRYHSENLVLLLRLPQLISVEDFAFRGQPVSLLVAALLRGLTLATFPAGVFVFHSNQLLDRINTQYCLRQSSTASSPTSSFWGYGRPTATINFFKNID
ncbi:hypothetical protein A6P54_16030 [Bacillus sp. MKU004]|nr:hypothetical protein A6P54_16030 [Bacillus sp. MKU004]